MATKKATPNAEHGTRNVRRSAFRVPRCSPRDRVAQLLDAVIEKLTEAERLMKVEGVGGVMALADVHAAGHAAWRAREELDLDGMVVSMSTPNATPNAERGTRNVRRSTFGVPRSPDQETDDGPRCA